MREKASKNSADSLEALRTDPRAVGCEKLPGNDELYRVRPGVHRIVYAVDDAYVVVKVVRVGHRSEVYSG